MAIPSAFINDIDRLLVRPLRLKVANMIARGVVHQANDGKKLQTLQVGALAGETIDDAEHHQPYGFSSVPLAGAEMIMIFPNGDRSHPIVLAASDRRHRPRGGEPGEVTIYNHVGATVRLTKDGDIVASAAPGREVRVDDGAGGAEAVAVASELQALATAFYAHTHLQPGTAPISTFDPAHPPVDPPSLTNPGLPGTEVLKAK